MKKYIAVMTLIILLGSMSSVLAAPKSVMFKHTAIFATVKAYSQVVDETSFNYKFYLLDTGERYIKEEKGLQKVRAEVRLGYIINACADVDITDKTTEVTTNGFGMWTNDGPFVWYTWR